MDITIQQDAISLRSEYEITTPGCIYIAQKKFFSWGDKIKIFGPRDRLVARIRSRMSFFRKRYDFELADGLIYRFRQEKLWTGVYACEGANDRYVLYEHRGLNYSVFQNDSQIAAFTKNGFKIGNGDRYKIQINDDANVVIVICLALTIDASENENIATTLTYDFGQIGPEARPFDKSWKPT